MRDYVRHGRRQDIIHAVHANDHGRRRAQVLQHFLHALLIWFDEDAVTNGFWGWRTPTRDGVGEEYLPRRVAKSFERRISLVHRVSEESVQPGLLLARLRRVHFCAEKVGDRLFGGLLQFSGALTGLVRWTG